MNEREHKNILNLINILKLKIKVNKKLNNGWLHYIIYIIIKHKKINQIIKLN